MRLERGLLGKNPLKLHRGGGVWVAGGGDDVGAWRGLSDLWPLGQLKAPLCPDLNPAAKGQSPGQAAGKEP